MSKFKSVGKAVSVGLLGAVPAVMKALIPKAPTINIPEAVIPAPAAPTNIASSEAAVSIGTSADVKNQRVSGRTATKKQTRASDPLGGLGRSGLSI